LKRSCCDRVATKLQWIALKYDHIYSELQMVIVTQKLSCKPIWKTSLVLIVIWDRNNVNLAPICTTFIYCTFVRKNWLLQDYNSQNVFHLEILGFIFLHISTLNVLEFQNIISTCFRIHALALVVSPRLRSQQYYHHIHIYHVILINIICL
jgi:hypothetical protein